MSAPQKILVVDDTPQNLKLLADLLEAEGYEVTRASSGPEALAAVAKAAPDLVLLDVMMPDMNGYEVCRKIRSDSETQLLPVVLVTALDPETERVKGIQAGADDFLSKPVHRPELLARVRSLLRLSELRRTTREQADQLALWRRKLKQRVDEQAQEIERKGRLKRFFSQQLAETLLSGGEDPLAPHRRNVSVVFLALKRFAACAEREAPEDVMQVLRRFHDEMGRLAVEHGATLGRFSGEGMMMFLNDPVEIPDPEERAVRLALAMRRAASEQQKGWRKRGHDLAVAFGIASGYATIGAVGTAERSEYSVIGPVASLATRLCAVAADDEILVSERFFSVVDAVVDGGPPRDLELKGFSRPVPARSILGPKAA